ncbi:hypothetical protein DFH06DRAFT_169847 [Mycena polygramma]|nr:hypothetical protein DFH06DRAFT_169847 [Mycena polygramma]
MEGTSSGRGRKISSTSLLKHRRRCGKRNERWMISQRHPQSIMSVRSRYKTGRSAVLLPPLPPRPPLSLTVRRQLGQALKPDGTFDRWVDCYNTFEADITERTGHVHARFRHGEWRVHKKLFHSEIPDDKPDLYTVTTAILATELGRIPDPREWVRCWFSSHHQVETVSGSRIKPPKYAVKRLNYTWITRRMECRFQRDNNTYTASRLAAVPTEKPSTTSQRTEIPTSRLRASRGALVCYGYRGHH